MKKIFIVSIMLICAVVLSAAIGPALWSDAKLRNQELVPTNGVFVDRASCKTRLFVSFCDISARRSSIPVFYMIVGLGSEETLSVMVPKGDNVGTRSARSADPSQGFTTNIGITYFWNRVATFLTALALALGLAFAAAKEWV